MYEKGVFMAYFLRQIKRKNDVYLCVYETYRDKDKKSVVNKYVKSFGSVEKLKSDKIQDPLTHFKKEVEKMNVEFNKKRNENKLKHIKDSPLRYLGYFPVFKILSKLNVKKIIDILQLSSSFRFNVFEILSALIASRIVMPSSKLKTYNEVFKCLYKSPEVSYDQILECIDFLGSNYEKIIEAFNRYVFNKYTLSSEKTYFDCTNFFFEIDKEDNLRRKGPSKENRKSPIVSMGLLLDSNCIPIAMKIFAGNESEKPILREIIKELKKLNNINGKTIRVADKGLNCAENILDAYKNKDGYIFSKSVKMLSEKEIIWLKSENDWREKYDEDGNLIYKYKSCIDDFPYLFTIENGKKIKMEITEKRVLTYNYSLAEKQKYEILKMAEKAKGLCYCRAKKSEYGESSKYVNFIGENEEKARAVIDEEKIKRDLDFSGYNLIVTSEIKMSSKEIYETYHKLWRIEESFKVMKSELDARPIYLQKEERIKGHLLICYLCVLLLRILQFKELNNKYSTSQLMKFMKDFKVVKDENKIINIMQQSALVSQLRLDLDEPITNLYLTEKEVKKMLCL